MQVEVEIDSDDAEHSAAEKGKEHTDHHAGALSSRGPLDRASLQHFSSPLPDVPLRPKGLQTLQTPSKQRLPIPVATTPLPEAIGTRRRGKDKIVDEAGRTAISTPKIMRRQTKDPHQSCLELTPQKTTPQMSQKYTKTHSALKEGETDFGRKELQTTMEDRDQFSSRRESPLTVSEQRTVEAKAEEGVKPFSLSSFRKENATSQSVRHQEESGLGHSLSLPSLTGQKKRVGVTTMNEKDKEEDYVRATHVQKEENAPFERGGDEVASRSAYENGLERFDRERHSETPSIASSAHGGVDIHDDFDGGSDMGSLIPTRSSHDGSRTYDLEELANQIRMELLTSLDEEMPSQLSIGAKTKDGTQSREETAHHSDLMETLGSRTGSVDDPTVAQPQPSSSTSHEDDDFEVEDTLAAMDERMVVTRPHVAETSMEISLTEGETIYVSRRPGSELWFGRKSDGALGLFPSFCVLMPSPFDGDDEKTSVIPSRPTRSLSATSKTSHHGPENQPVTGTEEPHHSAIHVSPSKETKKTKKTHHPPHHETKTSKKDDKMDVELDEPREDPGHEHMFQDEHESHVHSLREDQEQERVVTEADRFHEEKEEEQGETYHALTNGIREAYPTRPEVASVDDLERVEEDEDDDDSRSSPPPPPPGEPFSPPSGPTSPESVATSPLQMTPRLSSLHTRQLSFRIDFNRLKTGRPTQEQRGSGKSETTKDGIPAILVRASSGLLVGSTVLVVDTSDRRRAIVRDTSGRDHRVLYSSLRQMRGGGKIMPDMIRVDGEKSLRKGGMHLLLGKKWMWVTLSLRRACLVMKTSGTESSYSREIPFSEIVSVSTNPSSKWNMFFFDIALMKSVVLTLGSKSRKDRDACVEDLKDILADS
eukprot:TRINITY_DN1027_c1_g1_i1.p1 TRINITY_DN1027_c1_g1~~TRINITY_DN1027_c1_g1_i1.p1  ORF type:complete len:878 (-),score=270.82 TRINITY_DN1027_c1_g1_i1:112-2745(-)